MSLNIKLHLIIHIMWRRNRQPTPVLLPGKSHGQRSIIGSYSPWGCKESDMTERLHSLTHAYNDTCFLKGIKKKSLFKLVYLGI